MQRIKIALWLFISCLALSAYAANPIEIAANFSGSDVQHLKLNPDGTILAFTSFISTTSVRAIHLWDVKNQKNLPAPSFNKNIWALEFAPHDNLLAISYDDGSVKLWDIANSKFSLDIPAIDPSRSVGLFFSLDGKMLAARNHSLTTPNYSPVKWWNTSTGALLHKISLEELRDQRGEDCRDLAFSPDGKTLAIAYTPGVKFWDVITKQELSQLNIKVDESDNPRKIAFATNQQLTVFLSRGELGVYKMGEKKPVHLAKVTEDVPNRSPVFSQDGELFLGKGSVIWHTTKSKPVFRIRQFPKKMEVQDFAFSKDKKTLAIGVYDTNPFKIRIFLQTLPKGL